MAERIYPSSKPNPQPPPSAAPKGAAATAFPATKGQTYTRPAYRPNPQAKRRRRRRSGRICWCSCCLWLTLILIALAALAAAAGGLFYVLYRPHPPSFTVSSLRLTQLNVSSDTLTSRLNVSVTARNPNKNIDFEYDAVSVAVSSNGVDLGSGSIPGFLHAAKNISILKTTISATGAALDSSSASDLKKKTSLPLQIELDTKAGVKIWKMKTKKIGIEVSCDGVTVSVPKKKGSGVAETPDFNCKVKLRIKIWKWTF